MWPEWASVSPHVARFTLLGSTQKHERLCWDAENEPEPEAWLRDRNEE